MAITLDAVASARINSSVLSWSHIVGATANFLVVSFGFRGDATISAVTFNGVAMTQSRRDNCGPTGPDVQTAIYYMFNPPVGTFTVSVTINLPSGLVGGSRSYIGVDAISSTSGSNDHATAPTLNIASAADQVVVDVIHVRNQAGGLPTLTAGAGQTQQWNLDDTDVGRGAGSQKAGAATVTMSWTYGNPNTPHWAMSAIALSPPAIPPGLGPIVHDAYDSRLPILAREETW